MASLHHRRSIRLKGFDYSSPRLYFITICVQHSLCLFGEVKDGKMIPNEAGKMIETEWKKLPERFLQLELHEFKVMPNHFHGIIEIIKRKEPPEKIIERPAPVRAPLVGAPNNAGNIPLSDAGDGNISSSDAGDFPFQNASIASSPESEMEENATLARAGAPTRDARTDGGNAKDTDISDLALGEMMGAFKSLTTVEYIKGVKNAGWKPFKGKLWHSNFWEHIIKSRYAYGKISDYIVNNPARWKEDRFFK